MSEAEGDVHSAVNVNLDHVTASYSTCWSRLRHSAPCFGFSAGASLLLLCCCCCVAGAVSKRVSESLLTVWVVTVSSGFLDD